MRIVNTSPEFNRKRPASILAFALLTLFATSAMAQTDRSTDRNIEILQKIVARDQNAELYYRLGDLYVQKGRQTGDITYFNLAGNALHAALNLEPDFAPAHRHLAFVMYALHDFAGAVSEAQTAIKLDARDSYAYGVLGDAQLETGEYDAAAKTYTRMMALRSDLYSFSRRSGLETVRGDNDSAVSDLRRAVATGRTAGEPPEAIAWAQVMLAQDSFLMGKLDEASGEAEASLKTYPGYHRALALLGQVRAAQGRLDEAAQYYRGAIAVIPLPEYAAALSDVYAKLGDERDASQQRNLVEFIAKLSALNQQLYNRVLVDYYADHDIEHQKAVNLARGEFAIRQDIYGQDALAWSLYRAGRASEARSYAEAATRFKTTDARLYFHAAMIYAALGQRAQARVNLNRALRINPHFQPILDDVAAREYAVLNGQATSQYAQGNADVQR
jgi:tetratricopeptide (TPR) repeat protein